MNWIEKSGGGSGKRKERDYCYRGRKGARAEDEEELRQFPIEFPFLASSLYNKRVVLRTIIRR